MTPKSRYLVHTKHKIKIKFTIKIIPSSIRSEVNFDFAKKFPKIRFIVSQSSHKNCKLLPKRPVNLLLAQMNAVMEVEKREIKIKRHEKEKTCLKNNNVNKRARPTSFNVTGVSKFFLPEEREDPEIPAGRQHLGSAQLKFAPGEVFVVNSLLSNFF
jgi:hypothetical protein